MNYKKSHPPLKKSLGQNFLINEIISEKITSYITTHKQCNLIEIGCGDGALTKYLVQKTFCHFYIVELDNTWATLAKERFARANVTICHKDFLEFNFPKEGKNCVIGNIPYNITYQIIERIIDEYNTIDQVVLMMQEEVAQKLHKTRGKDYGPVSVLTQAFFDVELLNRVDPKEFSPAPKVISRVIKLIPKKNIMHIDNIQEFRNFLRILFKHPRKTIKNNIQSTYLIHKIPQSLHAKRAQELDHNELISLFSEILK
jgi:16S rRNA (adenine1518-N6/adenine1519-N6)-dimethyltransferase